MGIIEHAQNERIDFAIILEKGGFKNHLKGAYKMADCLRPQNASVTDNRGFHGDGSVKDLGTVART